MNAEELKDLLNSDYGNGRTPLIIASKYQKKDLVNRLLDAGSEVNKQDDGGRTALIETILGFNNKSYDRPFREYYFKMDNSYDGIPESEKLELVELDSEYAEAFFNRGAVKLLIYDDKIGGLNDLTRAGRLGLLDDMKL